MTHFDPIHIENISLSYRKKHVLKNINMTIQTDEITCLLGPNGAGKSSLFNLLIGFIQPDAGQLSLGQIPITHLSTQQRTKLGLSFLPQQACIYQGLSIKDNILSVLEMFESNPKNRMQKLDKILTDFKLTAIAEQLGSQVSGGQRRRTEIARCMATNPKIILLDEPFAGIDPIAISHIQKLILQLKAQGIGTLITDHQAHITLKFTDHAHVLVDGELLVSGASADIAKHPDVKRNYLGE